MKTFLIFLFFAFTISGTIFGQVPKIEAGVSKELAKWRAANYSNVKFDINIRLEKMSPTLTKIEKLSQVLRGNAQISLFNKGDLIILDWRKIKGVENLSKISNLSVNGRPAYFEETGGHLILKEGVLKNKSNTIGFDFTTPVQTGAAVTRYIDENDKSEYLYCVPNAENDFFPSFDQPDLKARFQLTATKEDSWKAEIITNSDHAVVQSFRLGESIYSFDETAPISRNIFAFAAGDFAEFSEKKDRKTAFGELVKEGKSFLLGGDELVDSLDLQEKMGARICVRKSQAEKFEPYAKNVFRRNRKGKKSAKLDIILLPEISNVQSVYDGIKFVPESSVFK